MVSFLEFNAVIDKYFDEISSFIQESFALLAARFEQIVITLVLIGVLYLGGGVAVEAYQEVSSDQDSTFQTVPKPEEPATKYHTVESGQTLSEISAQYGVTIDQLVKANDIVDSNLIFVGQALVIPEAQP